LKIQVGIGRKGSFKNVWEHSNPSIAQAFFLGLRLKENQKARIVNEKGEVVSKKTNVKKETS